jgi:hypothetical protein
MRPHSQPRSDLLPVGEDPGKFRFYKWQHLHIIVWYGAAGGDTAANLGRMTPKPAPGTRRSDIHIVVEGTGLPHADARAGLGQLMREMQDDLACLGVVIEGGGFWASAMRSAVTGLGLMAPKGLPFRALASIEDLIAWLPKEHRRRTGVTTDAVAFRRVLKEARASVPTKAA